jgi:hypothetical protein
MPKTTQIDRFDAKKVFIHNREENGASLKRQEMKMLPFTWKATNAVPVILHPTSDKLRSFHAAMPPAHPWLGSLLSTALLR